MKVNPVPNVDVLDESVVEPQPIKKQGLIPSAIVGQHVDEDDDDVFGKVSNDIEQAESVSVGAEANGAGKLIDSSERPCRNTYVRYKLPDNDWKTAKVLSVQPKQTGKYKDWINVHVDGEEDPICVNWDHVDEWSELPYPEQALILTKDQAVSQEVLDAKNREFDNMKRNDVFEIIPFDGQNTISSRWIITEKFKDGERIVKARLVARGFEEDSSDMAKDSPTCSRECLRLVFVVASLMSWSLQSIDISAAFLQGGPIDREIYLKPPSDICPASEIWRLKRCIYGLNDAPRSWYERVKAVLLQLGGTVSAYDNALFLWHDGSGNLRGILVSHVDDFAFCGDQWFQDVVIQGLRNRFRINTHDYGSFKYVGLDVVQGPSGIQVNQDAYIDKIMPIEISHSRRIEKDDTLTEVERSILRRFSGQMLWVSSQTRPDLSFDTCMMSNTGKEPRVTKILEANKALRKLKKDRVKLSFPCLGSPENLSVCVYSDATYASMPDGSSQGGHIVFLRGGNGKVVPINWQSKRLNRVTKSPLASETLALSEGADAGFLVSSQVQEIFKLSSLPVVRCLTDNRSLTDTLVTTRVISDRRLRVDVARLREMVEKCEIEISWIEGKQQIADSLTKRGASSSSLVQVLNSSLL